MGLKTTIGSQGVVTENVVGANKVVVEVPLQKNVTVPASESSANVASPVTYFRPTGTTVTGTLPSIGSAMVGREFLIVNDVVASSSVHVTSSDPIEDGGGYALDLSSSAPGGNVLKVIALSGSSGFFWKKLFQS